MAAYLMTGAEQPLWNSYYNLKEALKTQKPKLVVLDMFCPSRFYDDFQPGWADENLDGMRISLNKLEAVYTSVQEEQSHFFLGFTEYHSRYDQLTTEDFQNFVWNRKTQERWKGYTPLNRHAELTEPDMSHVTTSQEMTEKSKEYFEKIVELTKKRRHYTCADFRTVSVGGKGSGGLQFHWAAGRKKMDCCSGTLIRLPIIGRWGWTFQRIMQTMRT